MTDITNPADGIGEAWERGVAGPLAEFLTTFARGVAARPDSYSDDLVNASRAVLATVDAPEPTLADRLREQFYNPELTDEQHGIILDAEQMEHDIAEARARVKRFRDLIVARTAERDDARAQVNRLTTERDRLEAAQYLSDGSAWGGPVREPTVQKGAESNAESLDPASVKPGEAWIVECRGERRNAVKDNDDTVPWCSINADGWFNAEKNADITLITRLVPAPRVITDAKELLSGFSEGTIIRDKAGDIMVRDADGWTEVNSYEWVVSLPATVLWEPEVKK